MAYSERPGGLSELARFGFVNLSDTLARLDALVRLVGDTGRSSVAFLAKTADPDAALLALVKLAEAHPAKIKSLLKKDDSAQRLCHVLGASGALTEFLERHPANLDLFEEKRADLPTRDELTRSALASINDLLKPGFDPQSAWVSLRVEYRRQLCRIAIADLSAGAASDVLPQIAAALADLAGSAIEAGLAIARAELALTEVHGKYDANEVDDTRLAVIAMGKCGARELNYISDVDVIYVAESAGSETSDQRALEIATKLATRMMRAMDATAVEPPLWQVDPNLRPEGKSGALVRTLASHISYYEKWAESWEFQALLKARPLAGDWELGQAYANAVAPLVWASSSRDNFVESAQRMRERVMEHIPTNEVDRQIKLGPGGLRDIEFTVQLLQLVHGRNDESIRQRDTLSALSALVDGGYVSRIDAAKFSQHYRFLRALEHRIQLSQLRRTHLMPESEPAQRAIARSLNPKWTAEELLRHWQSVKQDVRSLHQQIFYRPLLSAVAKLDNNALELSSSQAKDRLRAIGFADPEGALTHIRALTSGLSRRAAIQKQLLPVLIQWFAEGTDPDAALLAFRRLSEDLGESHWYLRMLRDSSGAAQRMTQVLSNSRLATGLFERIPEAAAWFEREEDLLPLNSSELELEIESIRSRHDSIDAAASAIRHIRRRETLRIAMGAVLGSLKLADVARGITELTECFLRGMLNCVMTFKDAEIAERPVEEILDFAVVAMGRFGGAEMGFGSDADVMFVHQPRAGVSAEEAQKVAERIINELRRLCVDPVLEFELDLDLRPEGKKGAIARTIDSYAAYYKRWADTWESQALLRARVIAGSEELRTAFTQLIDQYRYPSNLSDGAVLEVRRIKARVETERLPQGADPKRHLKLGRGSLKSCERHLLS